MSGGVLEMRGFDAAAEFGVENTALGLVLEHEAGMVHVGFNDQGLGAFEPAAVFQVNVARFVAMTANVVLMVVRPMEDPVDDVLFAVGGGREVTKRGEDCEMVRGNRSVHCSSPSEG